MPRWKSLSLPVVRSGGSLPDTRYATRQDVPGCAGAVYLYRDVACALLARQPDMAKLSASRQQRRASRDQMSIKIKQACDGTYVIYRDGTPLSSGLTLDQANELASVLRCIDPGP